MNLLTVSLPVHLMVTIEPPLFTTAAAFSEGPNSFLGATHPAACTGNLNPDVVVVKSAEDWARRDDSNSLNRTRGGGMPVQRTMGSHIIVCVGSQNATQMRFAPNDDMIETLTPDRADQPIADMLNG